MLYNFVMFIIYFVEMLITYIFFSQIGEKKVKTSRCWLIGTLIFSTGFLVNAIFSNTVWLNVAYFAVINAVFGFLCFRIKPLKIIFYSVILDIFCIALEFATIFLISSIYNVETTSYLNQFSLLILEGIICKILYFLTCVVLLKFIKNQSKKKSHFPQTIETLMMF